MRLRRRVTVTSLRGRAGGRIVAPDQFWPRDAGRHGPANRCRWQADDETVLGDQRRGSRKVPEGDDLASVDHRVLSRRRHEHAVLHARWHAGHDDSNQPGRGSWASTADCRRSHGRTAGEVHDVLDQRTNPTWPTTWFAPTLTGRGAFTSTYEVMNHWGANHCVMTAGHVGHLFITLASLLRIPVYMHNVDESRSSARVPGMRSAPTIWKLPTSGPARTSARCTDE